MSANVHANHGHAHGAGGHHDASPGHATLGGYLTGFVLSVILTAVPFYLVMTGSLDSKLATAFVVMALAVVQIVVHMIFFLHMDAKSEGGWSLLALIFTLLLVGIAMTGSLWVMYHMNVNMMPTMHDMSQTP